MHAVDSQYVVAFRRTWRLTAETKAVGDELLRPERKSISIDLMHQKTGHTRQQAEPG